MHWYRCWQMTGINTGRLSETQQTHTHCRYLLMYACIFTHHIHTHTHTHTDAHTKVRINPNKSTHTHKHKHTHTHTHIYIYIYIYIRMYDFLPRIYIQWHVHFSSFLLYPINIFKKYVKIFLKKQLFFSKYATITYGRN